MSLPRCFLVVVCVVSFIAGTSHAAPCLPSPSTCVDAASFGARGDGMTMNTNAIQAAIDHVASLNGAPVADVDETYYAKSLGSDRFQNTQNQRLSSFPWLQEAASPSSSVCCVSITTGEYLSADLHLRSNVFLHLHHGAVLRAAINDTQVALINGVDLRNTGVVGLGTLHGQAEFFVHDYQVYPDERLNPRSDIPRPNLILMQNVTSLTLQGLRLRNSSSWNVHLLGCKNALVEGLDIYGDHKFPNNDGIDPESGLNITIRYCRIDVADDGICPKDNALYGPLSNVLVHDCVVRSRSSALKFGSNTDLTMSNIMFDRIHIHDSNRGIGLQQRSGGNITNVTFQNILISTQYTSPRWWGNGEPIWITSEPRAIGPEVGYISEISFFNITSMSENGALISGRHHRLSNITLDNVHLVIARSTDYLDRHPNPPLVLIGKDYRPNGIDQFGNNRIPSAINGIRFENAQVVMRNSSVTFRDEQSYYGDCVSADEASTVSSVGNQCVKA